MRLLARNQIAMQPYPSRALALRGKKPKITGFYQSHPTKRISMTHVVTENCIKCKYTDCVDVCPVDCFREGPNFLVIDPDECIDCAVCIPECPANAIFAEEDVPADQLAFIKLNVDLSQLKTWKSITKRKASLPDADEWNGKPNKVDLLER